MSKILYTASTISHINAFHLDYIKALRDEGHTVLVMAKGEGADFDIPFEKKLLSPINKSCRKRIREILAKEKFDLIILNTSLVAFHIRLAVRGKNRPRIVNIVHGYLFSKSNRGLKQKLRARLLLLAEKLTAAKTDAILTMNEEDTEIAKRHALVRGGIYQTLGMGVKYKAEEISVRDIRQALGCENSYALLFVGELSGRKNQRCLIKELARISEHIPNACLWLIGDGDERKSLGAYAEECGVYERVHFLGRRENPMDYMRACDVYVSAAKSEGLPFNIVEALGAGCDVVASDIKGQRDILSEGSGVLFSLGEQNGFSDSVLRLWRGDISIPSQAKRCAYERFCFDCVFSDTYEKIKEASLL